MADIRNPQELRDEWRRIGREHIKQTVIVDVMTAICFLYEEAVLDGTVWQFPDYGSVDVVVEALHDGVDVAKRTQAYFAQREADAYLAFTAATQQN